MSDTSDRARSIVNRIRGWFDYLVSTELDWIQVEVSSHCTSSCVYCPHTVYRDEWLSRNMSMATFERLLPAFRQTRLVHLQGWGEPLLNPRFFDMVALAKEAGCIVGTSSNGMLIKDTVAKQLVEAGIDFIALSLAGTTEKNDAVRKGTRLADVLNAIHNIDDQKRKMSASKPSIHIAYILLRSLIEDARKMPEMLRGLGIDQVVITTLDFVPAESFTDEVIVPADTAEHDTLTLYLEEIAVAGRRAGLDIHYYVTNRDSRNTICTENVQSALFISSDGAVSPCVFTNLPVMGVTYYADGFSRTYRGLTFGNVNEEWLGKIWRQKDYAAFRSSFSSGQPAKPCETCRKLNMTRRKQV